MTSGADELGEEEAIDTDSAAEIEDVTGEQRVGGNQTTAAAVPARDSEKQLIRSTCTDGGESSAIFEQFDQCEIARQVAP